MGMDFGFCSLPAIQDLGEQFLKLHTIHRVFSLIPVVRLRRVIAFLRLPSCSPSAKTVTSSLPCATATCCSQSSSQSSPQFRCARTLRHHAAKRSSGTLEASLPAPSASATDQWTPTTLGREPLVPCAARLPPLPESPREKPQEGSSFAVASKRH